MLWEVSSRLVLRTFAGKIGRVRPAASSFHLILCLLLHPHFACACAPPEIAALLSPDLADGFDFPVGGPDGSLGYTDRSSGRKHRGWSHQSDWIDALNLESRDTWRGIENSAAGQPVHSVAADLVVDVSADQICLEHRFIDNGQLQTVRIRYSGLSGIESKIGDRVKRRQRIAQVAAGLDQSPAQVTLTLQHGLYAEAATWPLSVREFIRSHRQLLVPARDARILIAIKHDFQLHVCEKGEVTRTFTIALGQDGRLQKRAEGDNRTPVGDYRITQKSLGPFDGTYGAYLGAAWLRLSYPNAFDARAAFREGRITREQHDAIVAAAKRGGLAPAGTPLGDGIGIHGWNRDWPDGENLLTWGCLSLREADLLQLHDWVKKSTRVLILP